MDKWQYHNPVRTQFGPDILKRLPEVVGPRKAVLVTTPGSTARGTTARIEQLLGRSLEEVVDTVTPNPTFEDIEATLNKLGSTAYDILIALGGGSVIDTTKALAAAKAVGQADWVSAHLKDGAPFPERFRPVPFIAIPTTAGTGSEVTMWATIWDMQAKKKYSLSHRRLYPESALLDPGLTLSLSKNETLTGGLDALSHAMESLWNRNTNPVSELFARKAIAMIFTVLPGLRQDPANQKLRATMLRASAFAGLAFSNTRTAIAHSLSYPLTAHFGLAHGLACALPLPHVLQLYRSREGEGGQSSRSWLMQLDEQDLKRFFDDIGISLKLKDYGLNRNDLQVLLDNAFTPERAGNFVHQLSLEDVRQLLDRMFHG